MGNFQSFKTLKRSFSILDTKTIISSKTASIRLRFYINLMWVYTPSICSLTRGPILCCLTEFCGFLRQKIKRKFFLKPSSDDATKIMKAGQKFREFARFVSAYTIQPPLHDKKNKNNNIFLLACIFGALISKTFYAQDIII